MTENLSYGVTVQKPDANRTGWMPDPVIKRLCGHVRLGHRAESRNAAQIAVDKINAVVKNHKPNRLMLIFKKKRIIIHFLLIPH